MEPSLNNLNLRSEALAVRLERSERSIVWALDQLDSVADLAGTIGPVTEGAFEHAVSRLQEAEERGFFTFARRALRIVDTVVTSFSDEDLERLGDNIVLMLNTVKDMTQPEILQFVRRTVADVEREAELPAESSYLALVGQLRDPEVRRGLARTLRLLSTIGAEAPHGGHAPDATTATGDGGLSSSN